MYLQEDRHKPEPSPVIHVRNVPDGAQEGDLVHAVQQFGAVG